MTMLEQKTQLDEAISAIELGAQEYRIGTRMVRRADLATLYAERRRLEQQLAREETGSVFAPRLLRR